MPVQKEAAWLEEDRWPYHLVNGGHAPHRSVGFELLDLFRHLRPQIHRRRRVARLMAFTRMREPLHSMAGHFVSWITAAFEAL